MVKQCKWELGLKTPLFWLLPRLCRLIELQMRYLSSLLADLCQFCPSSGYTALHIHQQIEVLIPIPSCAFHTWSEVRLLPQKQCLKSPLQVEEFKLSSWTIRKVLWLIHMLLLNLTQTGHQLKKLQAERIVVCSPKYLQQLLQIWGHIRKRLTSLGSSGEGK